MARPTREPLGENEVEVAPTIGQLRISGRPPEGWTVAYRAPFESLDIRNQFLPALAGSVAIGRSYALTVVDTAPGSSTGDPR